MSLTLRPLIFTPNDIPLVVDTDLARANPALAVLSAICHGGDAEVEATFPALAEVRWEAFMTATVGHGYHSELFRELAAQHEELGEARGEAQAILTVLDARGLTVPAEVRERILACTDLPQLNVWLRRAGTATTLDQVIDD